MFNGAYSIITTKDDLDKENTRTKQVLKENGYQESIISQIFKRITNNHSLPQSQQLTLSVIFDLPERRGFMSVGLLAVLGFVRGLSLGVHNPSFLVHI